MESSADIRILCPLCGHPQGNYPGLPTIDFSLSVIYCDFCGHNLVLIHLAGEVRLCDVFPLRYDLMENQILPHWLRDVFGLMLEHITAKTLQVDCLEELSARTPFNCVRCCALSSFLPDFLPLYFSLIIYGCPNCRMKNVVYHYGPRERWDIAAVTLIESPEYTFPKEMPDWLKIVVLASCREVFNRGPCWPAPPPNPITDAERHKFMEQLAGDQWPPV